MPIRSCTRMATRSRASTACARSPKCPARWWRWIPGPVACVAMVGGFSFDQSQFNRAHAGLSAAGFVVQADRLLVGAGQRLHAVDVSCVDAPDRDRPGQGAGVWRPENFSTGKYPRTGDASQRAAAFAQHRDGAPGAGHRHALDRRICHAASASMTSCRTISSYALGAGETTVMRMVTAYSMIANGGRRVKPTLIDRIQDRYGHTIFKHDQRECRGCDAPGGWKNQPEPQLVDRREQVLDSDDRLSDHRADGRRGPAPVPRPSCGMSASRSPARPAPPTRPRTSGSSASRPIVVSASTSATTSRAHSVGQRRARPVIPPRRSPRDFLKLALADKPADAVQGAGRHQADPGRRQDRPARRSRARRADTILEAFKPGTAPPDSYSVIGCVADADGSRAAASQAGSSRIGASSFGREPAGYTDGDGIRRRDSGRRRLRFAAPVAASAFNVRGTSARPERPCARKSNGLVEEIKQSVGLLRRHL